MSVVVENEKSFFLTVPATLVNGERDCASSWASKHIRQNKWYKWVLANYVEADNPNRNNQLWTLDGLQQSIATVENSPMNVGHRANDIVGSWTNAEIVYPNDSANPYVETLGVFWKYYFPEMLELVEKAYEISSLAVSMECVADSVTCVGEGSCGETFAYRGPFDESYCEHINSMATAKRFNNPFFLAGALVLPPDQPGWKNADVKDLSSLSSDDEKSRLISSINETFVDMDVKDIEGMMFAIQAHAKVNSVVEPEKVPASIIASRVAKKFIESSYRKFI